MIRINFLCQNLIIPPIDNQIVFGKHNQIEFIKMFLKNLTNSDN
jgi:hypothetical protein